MVQRKTEVDRFIRNAINASVYVAPRDHGLTAQELFEVGQHHNFMRGEISDALGHRISDDRGRYVNEPGVRFLMDLSEDPADPRNVSAIQFVFDEFETLARELGERNAQIERGVLTERAVAHGFDATDAEIAVACAIAGGLVRPEEGDMLRALNIRNSPSPSKLRTTGSLNRGAPPAAEYMEAVREVVQRRGGAIPAAREPLDAFGLNLERFGAPELRTWWTVTRSELRRASSGPNPMTTAVLSAAMAECALTVIAARAAKEAKSYALNGSRWSFDQLVKWSKKTTVGPIINDALGRRCDALNTDRQRIHPGRYLGDASAPQLADIRPEEAREARATVDLVLRAILDWDSKGPP